MKIEGRQTMIEEILEIEREVVLEEMAEVDLFYTVFHYGQLNLSLVLN